MKETTMIRLGVLLIGILFSNGVSARGHHGGWGHGHGGFYGGYYGGGIGLGFWGWPPYYSYPPTYVYPPAIVTVPVSPPIYIQQAPPPLSQPYPSGYWYYCFNPEGYYPYVNECPGGWQQVSPASQPR